MKRGPEIGAGFGVSAQAAVTCWGFAMPEWVNMLARMADASSQAQVGKEIGYSGSVVNAVLHNSYIGNLAKVEKAVRGRFMSKTVQCPVLGELAAHTCLQQQKLAGSFSTSSSFRMRMARACKGGCPHSQVGKPQLPPATPVKGEGA